MNTDFQKERQKEPVKSGDITIRTELQPGDLGYIMHRHGKLYAEEYGYGISFETYVGAGLHEFYQNYDPQMDRVWICEDDQKIVGFILLMHRGDNVAQLRYFYLEPSYRGMGLGDKLMELFCSFLRDKNYLSAFLWTTNELTAAASLYKKHKFKLTEEKISESFGKKLIEQKYELNLRN